jgi:outer membrane protein
MKTKAKLAAAIVTGLVAGSVLASTSVGVVNVEKVLDGSKSVQATKKKLQAEFKTKHEHLQVEQQSLETLMNNYKRNESVMSKTELKKMQKKIGAQQERLFKLGQLYAGQAEKAQAKVMKSFMTSFKSAAAAVAKQDKLSLVIPSATVIYSADSMNITKAVITQINK